MGNLTSFIGSKPAPPAAPGDVIYLTHYLDNSRSFKTLVLNWTLRFDDVLDADKLHASLCRLLEIGDWRRLGGRLRVGKTRNLEIHVPSAFSEERPAVNYTHNVYDIRIRDHSVAANLPESTDKPSIHPGPSNFRNLGLSSNTPARLDDFLSQDVPPLSLHVNSFTDATLVSLSWPHIFFDASGFREVLKAWSLVLAGREDEVPRLLGARENWLYDMAETTDQTPRNPRLESMVLTTYGFVKFLLYFVFDLILHRTVEDCSIYVPKTHIQRLHQQALEEEGLSDENSWISESDVLTAWIARIRAKAQSKPTGTTINTAVDIRPRLSRLHDAPGVYVQNLISVSPLPLSDGFHTRTLGHIANAHRQALLEQTSEAHVLDYLRLARRRWDCGQDPTMLFGPPEAKFLIVTNRSRADIFRAARFGPAVLRSCSLPGSIYEPGAVMYHHSTLLDASPMRRNIVCINGKDLEGGFWMTANLKPQEKAVLEQELMLL